MDATKKFEKLITDKKEMDGLPPSALGLFAQAAVSKVSILTIIYMQIPMLFSFGVRHFILLIFVCDKRVMKMQLLRMDHGSLHWMLLVISLSCNMPKTVLFVRNSTVRI